MFCWKVSSLQHKPHKGGEGGALPAKAKSGRRRSKGDGGGKAAAFVWAFYSKSVDRSAPSVSSVGRSPPFGHTSRTQHHPQGSSLGTRPEPRPPHWGNVCPARYLSINYPDFSPRFTLSWRSPPSRPRCTARLPYKARCIMKQYL